MKGRLVSWWGLSNMIGLKPKPTSPNHHKTSLYKFHSGLFPLLCDVRALRSLRSPPLLLGVRQISIPPSPFGSRSSPYVLPSEQPGWPQGWRRTKWRRKRRWERRRRRSGGAEVVGSSMEGRASSPDGWRGDSFASRLILKFPPIYFLRCDLLKGPTS